MLGNHDRPRVATRFGEAQARVAAMLLLTLRGTPTIYYGDELGMADVAIPPDQVQDPRELREPGIGLGRDPVRTPMAWDASAHAGFTTAAPWLPLHPDWHARNVAAQREDPDSMWRLYRDLLALRRAHSALSVGRLARRSNARAVCSPTSVAPATNGCWSCSISATPPKALRYPNGPRVLSVLLTTGAGDDPAVLGPNEGYHSPRMKIAMLAPIAWRTPPRHYGPWELVTSLLTEALVARGVDVTLFATQDSITAGTLAGVVPRGYEEDPAIDAKVWEYRPSIASVRAGERVRPDP